MYIYILLYIYTHISCHKYIEFTTGRWFHRQVRSSGYMWIKLDYQKCRLNGLTRRCSLSCTLPVWNDMCPLSDRLNPRFLHHKAWSESKRGKVTWQGFYVQHSFYPKGYLGCGHCLEIPFIALWIGICICYIYTCNPTSNHISRFVS